MTDVKSSILVGARHDPHVAAIADILRDHAFVVDVESIRRGTFEMSPSRMRIENDDGSILLQPGTTGWIRRLSPLNWEVGTRIGSHDAAVKSSWLALLATVLRNPNVAWLSSLDSTNSAENKLTQYTVAQSLGLQVPRTLVTNSAETLSALPANLVAKTLGPGHYKADDETWRTVFTESFDPERPEDLMLLGGPPFIVQERIDARAHLRVVTVADRAWSFALDAASLPIDWREVDEAHDSWEWFRDRDMESDAIRIAAALNLGYSSQDWIESDSGRYLVDLNPSGQWLFLPEPKSREVSQAIAEWLESAP